MLNVDAVDSPMLMHYDNISVTNLMYLCRGSFGLILVVSIHHSHYRIS